MICLLIGFEPWLPPKTKIVFLFGDRFSLIRALCLSVFLRLDLIGFPVRTILLYLFEI